LSAIHDNDLLQAVVSQAQMDASRGNLKVDFGYASGQNLMCALLGTTIPRILDKSHEPMFLKVQKDLSVLIDLVSKQFSLPLYHQLDNFHARFCHVLHPQGIIPAWRVAISRPDQFLQVHEDSNSECCALMSPVGVLSRLVGTVDGPLRLTKIGYSCKPLLEATLRESVILPIVNEFLELNVHSQKYSGYAQASSLIYQRAPRYLVLLSFHVTWNILLVFPRISMSPTIYKSSYLSTVISV
jgi:hypothetical protein